MDKQKLLEAGIDFEGAIARFAGNEALYEKYLKRFETDTHCADAMKALEEKNYDEVLAQTHAMKGMVGTLGMNHLFEACQKVVDAVRANQLDQVAAFMDDVVEENKVIMKIYE